MSNIHLLDKIMEEHNAHPLRKLKQMLDAEHRALDTRDWLIIGKWWLELERSGEHGQQG